MNYLGENNFFASQHDFLHGRSCETQLFELITDIHIAVQDKCQIDGVFVDFKKAFDKVPHARLIFFF